MPNPRTYQPSSKLGQIRSDVINRMNETDMTALQVARAAKVAHPGFYKFLNGHCGLQFDSLERVLAVLSLRLKRGQKFKAA